MERKIVLELFKIGAFKLGSFQLKSGIISPIYIDLRVCVSYPILLQEIGNQIFENVSKSGASYDLLCGVPYAALPIASSISLTKIIPMLIRRKEGPKGYGTKKALEGIYTAGQTVLVIEDLVTTGGSVLEVVESLRAEGLQVKDVCVLVDREQGAKKILEKQGLRLHSIVTLTQILTILKEEGFMSAETSLLIEKFLKETVVSDVLQPKKEEPKKQLTFSQRKEMTTNVTAKKLYALMEEKQSNLSVAVDLTKKSEILALADKIGKSICVLKTHVDIIEDFDQDFVIRLQKLAEKHKFLIFEDRKFADIGNTVKLQYSSGVYKIAEWSDITNAHIIPGKGIIDGLKQVGLPKGRGLLLLAEMSSEGSLATGDYTASAVKMALENKDFVIGFICQKKLTEDCAFIHMTPGVKLQQGSDNLGQQYTSVEDAIKNGTDVIIVGRGIYEVADVEAEAQKYRIAGWKAYEQRLSNN